jgi:hypothetical protein
MGIRTVRLDSETENVLKEVRRVTGLSMSAALKRGLRVLRDEATRQGHRPPYDVYQTLDLGPGGYAIAPSSQTRRGMVESLRRKQRR